MLCEFIKHFTILNLPVHLIPVNFHMRHVDNHYIVQHVDILEVPLELFQFRPRTFELAVSLARPLVHHHANRLQLPVEP